MERRRILVYSTTFNKGRDILKEGFQLKTQNWGMSQKKIYFLDSLSESKESMLENSFFHVAFAGFLERSENKSGMTLFFEVPEELCEEIYGDSSDPDSTASQMKVKDAMGLELIGIAERPCTAEQQETSFLLMSRYNDGHPKEWANTSKYSDEYLEELVKGYNPAESAQKEISLFEDGAKSFQWKEISDIVGSEDIAFSLSDIEKEDVMQYF